MKKGLMLVFLTLGIQISLFGQYFKVKEFDYYYKGSLLESGKKHSFKIQTVQNSNVVMSYPITSELKGSLESDTIEMISELLKFEGDERNCVLPIICYDPMISQIYMNDTKEYSLQIEALFIINQLYFKKPFTYSPFPALLNTKTSCISSIKGRDIKSAYAQYKLWFDKVKRVGLHDAQKQGFTPLSDSIRWYR